MYAFRVRSKLSNLTNCIHWRQCDSCTFHWTIATYMYMYMTSTEVTNRWHDKQSYWAKSRSLHWKPLSLTCAGTFEWDKWTSIRQRWKDNVFVTTVAQKRNASSRNQTVGQQTRKLVLATFGTAACTQTHSNQFTGSVWIEPLYLSQDWGFQNDTAGCHHDSHPCR